MASLGDLTGKLRLDGVPQMRSGLEGVGKAVGSLKNLLGTLAGPLALLGFSFGAFRSVEGITEALRGTFEVGKELQTLSRTSGQTVRDLVVLRKTFEETGVGADAVPTALRLMQRALGGVNEEGQPTAAVFSRLRLSIQQLKGETAIQQLQAIGTAIHKLPDQASQAAAAMQAFGRSGAEMLAVFADPSALEEAAGSAGGIAAIYQRSAATFAKISNDLEVIGHKMRGFFAGVADQIAPVLLPLLDKLKSIDLTGIGEQVGKVIRMISAALQQGRFGDVFAASMEIGIDESINYLAGALPPIGAALNKLLGSDLDALSDGLQSVFEGLFDLITGGLMRAFQQPVRYLQAAIEEIFQMRDLKKSLDAGKTLDRDNLAGMTPDALDRRIHQLEGLMRKGGGTVQQQQFIQDQYQRATRFKEDPSQFVHGWESVQDIMDRNAKEQVRFGIGAGKTADEWEAGGKAQMALVGPQMAKAVEGISDTVKTLFSNLKRADVVDDTGARDKLAGLLRQLSNLGAAGVETSGPNGPLSAGGGAMKMDGDRLAKIGGFIGGGGGPALDFHRRTAVATEKTSAGVQSLLQRWTGGDKSSMTAVWA